MRTLPRQVVVVQHRRASGAGRGHHGGRRRVQGQRAEVLDDDQIGPGQRRVHLGPVGGSGASMANPGRTWSTGPAPATVRTVQPRRPSAPAHFAASTATPSAPPSRNETMHAVATPEL